MSARAELFLASMADRGLDTRVSGHISLSKYASMRTGGPADLFFAASTGAELADAVSSSRDAGLPYTIIGGGTNILVSDRGVRGLVIQNRTKSIAFEEEPERDSILVTADSGISLSSFARRLIRRGYTGLEWAATVPGTVGGAIIGNAGAYGGDMTRYLIEASVLLEDGTRAGYDQAALRYEYRQSALKGRVYNAGRPPVVLTGTFRLPKGDASASMRRVEENLAHRRRTQPAEPSVGSIFRNPPGDHAGRLIESVGLKGLTRGGAQFSTLHANWIINVGGATSAEVVALIDLARMRVFQAYHIALTPEILFVGDWDSHPPYRAL